jgi:hypothetical protein
MKMGRGCLNCFDLMSFQSVVNLGQMKSFIQINPVI